MYQSNLIKTDDMDANCFQVNLVFVIVLTIIDVYSIVSANTWCELIPALLCRFSCIQWS